MGGTTTFFRFGVGVAMAGTVDCRDEEPRCTGTVFIARDDGRVWGYWDALPDAPPAQLELLPDGLTLRAAATWGLERTVRVLVRTETSGYVAVGPEAARFADDQGVEGTASIAEVDDL